MSKYGNIVVLGLIAISHIATPQGTLVSTGACGDLIYQSGYRDNRTLFNSDEYTDIIPQEDLKLENKGGELIIHGGAVDHIFDDQHTWDIYQLLGVHHGC